VCARGDEILVTREVAIMEHSRLVAALLGSPQGRDALATGHAGMIIRLIRQALGWTQQDLAMRSGYSQPTISRIECGKTRSVRDIDVLADLAQVLGVPPAVLGLAPDQRRTLDPVDRRDVLGGGVALAVSALLPQGVATAGRIDAAQVVQCWTALNRLIELDDHHGGGPVYELTAGMAQRLQDAMSRSASPCALRQLNFQVAQPYRRSHEGSECFCAAGRRAGRQRRRHASRSPATPSSTLSPLRCRTNGNKHTFSTNSV